MAVIVASFARKLFNFKYDYRYTKLFNSFINVKNLHKSQCLSIILDTNIENSDERERTINVSTNIQPYVKLSIEDILLDIEKFPTLHPKDSVALLKAFRVHKVFKKANLESIVKDKRFETLCIIFKNSCYKMHPILLLSGLRSLLEVGVPSDSEFVTLAEEAVLQKIFQFSITEVIRCLYFHKNFMNTDLQKQVVFALVNELKERTSEISSGADIVMLLHIFHLFDSSTKSDLEYKIIQQCKNLNMYELHKILLVLAEKAIRNKPIINAVSQYLLQNVDTPKVKDVIDVLYALKTLNYYEGNLMSYLLDTQISNIPLITEPLLISRLLTACGHLKWRHSGILNACGQWIKDHIDICRTRELTTYILTLAALNFHSTICDEVLDTIVPHLSLEKVGAADIWLDVVWSLAILEHLNRETLQQVLSNKFYKTLVDGPNFKTMKNKLKLMNLKGVMQQKFPECIFACDLNLEPIEIPQSQEEKIYRGNIIKALSNFLPKEKYLCINQSTDTGIFIDAEFILDKKQKPLSLSDFGVLPQTSNSPKSLPANAKRFALLVFFYDNYTLHEQTLTGISALTVRLLAEKYNTVVQIAYDEFAKNKTELARVKYLLQNIM